MDRVIEIVTLMMKQLIYQGEINYSQKSMAESLVQLGYHLDEIEMAFKFLHNIANSFNNLTEPMTNFAQIRNGFRVFSSSEQEKLSLAFQDEILRIANNKLLTNEEIENIIAEAMLIETAEVGLKELDLILHKLIKDEERLLMINPQSVSLSKVPVFLIN
ncbi:MAG TPA: DUF494 family protein [Bacillota bacterium]|nr:DUF494 family protein [Bacillota bacterium]HOL10159.1 DUF494 family protein [Bacillota bacterium]HPO97906.1 DUF494 family protein [Bacillota bacterium]